MRVPAAPKAVQIFLHVLRARGWIAGAFVVLATAGIYGALQVPNDPSTERLIVASDPVALATRDFDRIFPEGVQALIMLETPEPLGLTALRAADRLEQELARIPQVEAHSLLDLYRRAVSTGEITRLEAGRVRAFATGTPLFRRAGFRSEEHTSELQSRLHLVCRLLLEKKKRSQPAYRPGGDPGASASNRAAGGSARIPDRCTSADPRRIASKPQPTSSTSANLPARSRC